MRIACTVVTTSAAAATWIAFNDAIAYQIVRLTRSLTQGVAKMVTAYRTLTAGKSSFAAALLSTSSESDWLIAFVTGLMRDLRLPLLTLKDLASVGILCSMTSSGREDTLLPHHLSKYVRRCSTLEILHLVGQGVYHGL